MIDTGISSVYGVLDDRFVQFKHYIGVWDCASTEHRFRAYPAPLHDQRSAEADNHISILKEP